MTTAGRFLSSRCATLDVMEELLAQRAAFALLGIGEGLENYMREQTNKSPHPNSVATNDSRLHENDGRSNRSSLAAAVSFVTLGVASDHLGSAHRLIVDGNKQVSVNRYAVYSVMRVAMEVAALAWWVVDPTATSKARLSRALTVMENSRNRRQAIEEVASGPRDTNYLDTIRVGVEEEARKHHLQKITNRIDEGKDVRVPDSVDLIRLQFTEVSLGAEDDAVAMYGMMSESMHGNILGTMAGFVQRDPGDLGGPLMPAVSVPHLVSAAHISAHGVAAAMLDFLGYMGWDMDRWSDMAQPHLTDLEEALGTAKALRSPAAP